MARGGIRAAGLPLLAWAATLAAGTAAAQEPLRLDPAMLDLVTAGGGAKARAAPATPSIVTLPGGGVVGLSLGALRRQIAAPQTGGSGGTSGGKRSVSGSGKKTFKAARVTRPHLETLVVSGSAGG